MGMSFLVVMSGIAIFFTGFNEFTVRSTGLLVIALGAYLAHKSNVLIKSNKVSKDAVHSLSDNRIKPLMWAIGLVLILVTGISIYFLYKDAIDGYHQFWPLYFCLVATLSCAIYFPFLYVKYMASLGDG